MGDFYYEVQSLTLIGLLTVGKTVSELRVL